MANKRKRRNTQHLTDTNDNNLKNSSASPHTVNAPGTGNTQSLSDISPPATPLTSILQVDSRPLTQKTPRNLEEFTLLREMERRHREEWFTLNPHAVRSPNTTQPSSWATDVPTTAIQTTIQTETKEPATQGDFVGRTHSYPACVKNVGELMTRPCKIISASRKLSNHIY